MTIHVFIFYGYQKQSRFAIFLVLQLKLMRDVEPVKQNIINEQ